MASNINYKYNAGDVVDLVPWSEEIWENITIVKPYWSSTATIISQEGLWGNEPSYLVNFHDSNDKYYILESNIVGYNSERTPRIYNFEVRSISTFDIGVVHGIMLGSCYQDISSAVEYPVAEIIEETENSKMTVGARMMVKCIPNRFEKFCEYVRNRYKHNPKFELKVIE